MNSKVWARHRIFFLVNSVFLALSVGFLILFIRKNYRNERNQQSFLSKLASRAAGIENVASNCYANSVVQMLYRVEPVRSKILSVNIDQARQLNIPDHYIKTILGLKHVFEGLSNPESRVVRNHNLQFIPPQFTLGEPQDADEFYTAWMDILLNFLGVDLSVGVIQRRVQLTNNSIIIYNSQQKSRAYKALKSRDMWSSLRIFFPEAEDITLRTLDELLKHPQGPFGEEVIDIPGAGLYSQKYQITQLPKYFVASFARTGYDPKEGSFKINIPVVIPENLSLNQFFSENQEASRVFNLRAFVMHIGTPLAGHYSVYVKDQGQWLHIDDARIDPVSREDAMERVKYSNLCLFEELNKDS